MSKGSYLDENCGNCMGKCKVGRTLFRYLESTDKENKLTKVSIKVCDTCYPKVILSGYWKSSL